MLNYRASRHALRTIHDPLVVSQIPGCADHLFRWYQACPERFIDTDPCRYGALAAILVRELERRSAPHCAGRRRACDSGVVVFGYKCAVGVARCWSGPAGIPGAERENCVEVPRRVRDHQRKGATLTRRSGPADRSDRILRNERRVLTFTRTRWRAADLRDLALSLPTVVAGTGALQVLEPELDERERDALGRSAEILRRARSSIA